MRRSRHTAGLGVNVVVDVGHHDCYSVPQGNLFESARRLTGLPVLFVGVRCPVDVIVKRRQETWDPNRGLDDPIRLWQREVHIPSIYDIEIDTSKLTPEICAAKIQRHLFDGPEPTAFKLLATK